MKVVIRKPIGANERSTGNKVTIEYPKHEKKTIIEGTEVIPDSKQGITDSNIKLIVDIPRNIQTKNRITVEDTENAIIIQCAGKIKVDKEFSEGQVKIMPERLS